jgi:NitT/TauT family transport system ATP-binding protein
VLAPLWRPPRLDAAPPDVSLAAVSCEGVGFDYPAPAGVLTALTDINLHAKGFEFVSIVGPSGCGKSTLLRILAGLQQPTVGRVETTGVRSNGKALGGLVFQEHGTFPWMNVLENLAFGLEMRRVPVDERQARARAFAERLGLEGFLGHYPHQLSVGMRQRVQLGRAFLSDAPVLLMDEPFGALDAQTRWAMQEELLRIWSGNRKLVLFVTHDLDEAVLLSDRVLVMSGRPGTIVEELAVPIARPRELQRNYREIRDVSMQLWQLLRQDVRIGLGMQP